MRLYLVQHGEALPEEKDAERHLSDVGKRDVERVGRFLKSLNLPIAAVWHSGKPRARQTAEALAAALPGKPPIVRREGLAPKDSVKPVRDAIEHFAKDLMIVGHLPLLSTLATLLLTGEKSGDVVAFRYGGVVCLERAAGGGGWALAWMVVPDLIPA
jgi:phosphohistidine phosphatase